MTDGEDSDKQEPEGVTGVGASMMAAASMSAEGTVTITWDAISLTIAVALIGVFATLSGVFIAPWSWHWRLGYVVVWLVVVGAMFWVGWIRDGIIYFIRRRIPNLPPDVRR